ncbi:MAG TPA: hypothetical protein H9867_05270 [Candidatus Corynebacterium gallistercoris]|uniref:Secreted protein n=1 Tax=Candidatus Corynebacterium gallistercoris TaxID=2838530 RepID=A0A9D1URB2_9CORY|nr:hypothetical protein [Candidatus Corynebacterium gallistercoris]
MTISSILRRTGYAAVAFVAGLSATSAAQADDTVAILAGDGGIVEEKCGTQPQQIRIDSSSLSSFSACFSLAKPTGWAALNLPGSYGVVNNLTVAVDVAFKLPDGTVYWQDTVGPGQVKSVDVN